MSSNDIELLRRRMEEVAALPPEHPDRQAVVREISAIDGQLEREWLELLRHDEQMRLELGRLDPPPGFEERLLKIPAQHAQRRSWFSLSRRSLAALAAMVVIGALGALAFFASSRAGRAEVVSEFASLAMASHESRPELSVVSSDWQVLEAKLQDGLPYDIQRPQLDGGMELVGGKVTTLAGKPVVYTRWKAGGKTYSLYQFCAKDFGIRGALERQTVTPKVGGGGHCEVIVWTEAHCDYALVVEGDQSGQRPTRV